MTHLFLTLFSFGFLSAIATLLVQILVYTPLTYAPQADITILIFFVLLEELFKCLFLRQFLIRKMYSFSFFSLGIFFGLGFFFGEALLIYANSQENFFSLQILYVLLIHLLTSLLWSKALIQKKYFIPIALLAIMLHLLYNLFIYFFFA